MDRKFENWRLSESSNALTDAKEAIAMLESDEAGVRSPALFVRCTDGDFGIFIAWKKYLSDNNIVTRRFDKNEPVSSRWSLSSDKTATFVQERDVRQFAEYLMQFEKLVVGATPYQEGQTTASFTLAGARAAIAPVLNSCLVKK